MKEYERLLQLFLKHLHSYRTGLAKKTPAELYQPCDYILSLGGKRLRPLLALVACELFGKHAGKALNAALAVELFHNFSLIHDDILDKAPLRRGQPTVHTRWSQDIAILSGDAMLVEANRTLEGYTASQFRQLSVLFNTTAGLVCEGQQMDMNFENARLVNTQEYIRMIQLKTAVLLGCSLQMGAVVAGATLREQKLLYTFGEHLGIAFQLLDDYLDAFSLNSSGFGKQQGGDILSGKKTFLAIKTQELASPLQLKRLQKLNRDNKIKPEEKISETVTLFKETGADQLCLAEAKKHTGLAIKALDKLNAAKNKKDRLKAFALELINRQH